MSDQYTLYEERRERILNEIRALRAGQRPHLPPASQISQAIGRLNYAKWMMGVDEYSQAATAVLEAATMLVACLEGREEV